MPVTSSHLPGAREDGTLAELPFNMEARRAHLCSPIIRSTWVNLLFRLARLDLEHTTFQIKGNYPSFLFAIRLCLNLPSSAECLGERFGVGPSPWFPSTCFYAFQWLRADAPVAVLTCSWPLQPPPPTKPPVSVPGCERCVVLHLRRCQPGPAHTLCSLTHPLNRHPHSLNGDGQLRSPVSCFLSVWLAGWLGWGETE